jgi:hypothetical protein
MILKKCLQIDLGWDYSSITSWWQRAYALPPTRAMEVLLLSFLSIALQDERSLTDDETTFITSILFLGALVRSS